MHLAVTVVVIISTGHGVLTVEIGLESRDVTVDLAHPFSVSGLCVGVPFFTVQRGNWNIHTANTSRVALFVDQRSI